MAVFSTNQNRQFYYAGAYKDTKDAVTAPGNITVLTDKESNVYFMQKGHGGIVRSDMINPALVSYAKISTPEDMQTKLKAVKVTLDNTVNGGAPIVGEDYILRVNFRAAYGPSDEDIYQRYGAVHVTNATKTAQEFWKAMGASLQKNLKKNSPLEVEIQSDGVVLKEKDPSADWVLGISKLTTAQFDVIPTTVYEDGVQVIWGKVEKVAGAVVENGYNIADLEYFCMGERADQYRGVNWPNNIVTKYFVDPTKKYYCLDIHYAYQGTCEDIQKSEKDIIIVAETQTPLDSIVTKLEEAKIKVIKPAGE